MKICIASNKEFAPQSLPVIIPSLLETGFLPNEISVFISGCDKRIVTEIRGIQTIHLPYSSFEYSPLIDIVENQLESDWWFLIHDTCKVGLNFKKIVTEFLKNSEANTVAIKRSASMSMGAYRYSFLQSHKKELIELKNTDYSENSLQKFKKWTISHEDHFLIKKSPSTTSYFGNKGERSKAPKNWYNESKNTERMLEYYPQIDLYKMKGNWKVKPIYKLDL